MEVFTEAWCAACCDRLNQRESYRLAAAGWEGAAVLLMSGDPEQGIDSDRAVWLDIHHGQCRGARVATAEDLETAPYLFRADPAEWKRLLHGEMDPVAAVMQGKLKLSRGNLFTLAKYAPAAREMVHAAGEVGGTFPGAAR
ncbi:MAG: SCP2 sterol-binding domain-containing protein [Gemmatimonadetes bacterium]|nr:SCP2 sterol-binding domain-containing protein [Gemmatimonadota bacterium]